MHPVDPHTLERFLARVAQHKVTVLAFSTSTKASIPLRHAAQQHQHYVVAGRVQWRHEVIEFASMYCAAVCDRVVAHSLVG